MNIDLNEENYDYHKLLNLFCLNENFNEADLKQAKLKVCRLHPDKSNLDIKYFLFFYKMYHKLEEVYRYLKNETSEEQLRVTYETETHFKDYLERNNINPKTNFKKFSREFNKMFENVYISDNDDGYDDWLKSNDNLYDKDNIEKSRKMAINQSQIISKNNEIEEYGGFTKKSLNTYDVKETHTNSVIAIDIQKVYDETPKFSSVDEYKQHLARENQSNVPLSTQQSCDYIKQKEQLLNSQAKKMAYDNMRRKEQMSNKYNDYITNYLRLEN